MIKSYECLIFKLIEATEQKRYLGTSFMLILFKKKILVLNCQLGKVNILEKVWNNVCKLSHMLVLHSVLYCCFLQSWSQIIAVSFIKKGAFR